MDQNLQFFSIVNCTLPIWLSSWKRTEIWSIAALKSLGWVGGGCTYDYNVSLSPNLWLMTFDLDLDLDLGLTIKKTCGCRFLCQKSDINIVIVSYAVMQREHEVWDIWLKDYSKLIFDFVLWWNITPNSCYQTFITFTKCTEPRKNRLQNVVLLKLVTKFHFSFCIFRAVAWRSLMKKICLSQQQQEGGSQQRRNEYWLLF